MLDKKLILISIFVIFIICIFSKKNKKVKENFSRRHHWHPHIHHVHPQKVINTVKKNVKQITTQTYDIVKPAKNFVSKQVSNKLSSKSFLNSVNHIGDFKQLKAFVDNHNIDELNKALSKINKKYHQELFDKWNNFESFSLKVGKDINSISKHVGDAYVKIGNKIAKEELLALQSFLDPCYWALDFGCHLYVETLVLSIESLLAENTAKDEVEFTSLIEFIKISIQELAEKVAEVVCQKLVATLIVPLLSPIFILVIYSITKDKTYTVEISGVVTSLFEKVMTNLIIKGKTGVTMTFIIINFVAGFMCSGNWFGIEISSVIKGFIPYAQIEFRALGLNCEKAKKEPSYSQNKYDNLKKENNQYVYIHKGGTCETRGLLPITNLETCKKAGQFKVGNNKYDSRMPKDGYEGNVGRPFGCATHNLNHRLYMFNGGQGQCGQGNFGCLCLNKKLKKNTVVVRKGKNCEESGYRTITVANKCFFALKNAGFYGYDVHQPRTYINNKETYLPILDKGDDAPYGCTVDTTLTGEWSKNRGEFYQNKTGECGKNGKVCVCGDTKSSTYSNLNAKLKETKDLIITSNPLNVLNESKNFAITSNIDCLKNGLKNTSSEAMCQKAANELGIKYGGVDNTNNYKNSKPNCGYDKIKNEIKFYKNGLNCDNTDSINCTCSKNIPTVEKIGDNYVKVLDNKKCSDHQNYKIDNESNCNKLAKDNGMKYGGIDGTRKYSSSPPGCGFDNQRNIVKFYKSGLDCANKDNVDCLCKGKIVSQSSSSTTNNKTKKLGNYTQILNKTKCSSNNVLAITNDSKCSQLAKDNGMKYGGSDGTRKYSSSPPGCGYDNNRNMVKFYRHGLDCANNDRVDCLCSNS